MEILQARILEWVAIFFFRGSSQPRDWIQVSCIVSGFFTIWATREALIYLKGNKYFVLIWIIFFPFMFQISNILGFPGGASGKEPTCQCRRSGFIPWVGKILWGREWQPTPVFLPGESHGQRSLAGYSPWGHKELDMTEWPPLSLLIDI